MTEFLDQSDELQEKYSKLYSLLDVSEHIAFFTGAGISTAANIPGTHCYIFFLVFGPYISPLTYHRLHITAYISPLTYHRLHITAYISPLTYHRLHITAYISPLTYHRLHITAYISPLTYHRLHITAYISPLTYCYNMMYNFVAAKCY